MKKEDIFQNLNLNLEGDNRQEKVPFITISNSKSKHLQFLCQIQYFQKFLKKIVPIFQAHNCA